MTTEQEKTPAEILAELEERLAARVVEVTGQDPETQRKIEEATLDLEYLALVEKFNALGKQDQKYAIVDLTAHGKGFVVVVIGPQSELHRRSIVHAANGDNAQFLAKQLEIVRDCVKHPPLEVYAAVTSELPSIGDVVWMAIQDLWGARAKIRRGK